jgi:hypothetical protein
MELDTGEFRYLLRFTERRIEGLTKEAAQEREHLVDLQGRLGEAIAAGEEFSSIARNAAESAMRLACKGVELEEARKRLADLRTLQLPEAQR